MVGVALFQGRDWEAVNMEASVKARLQREFHLFNDEKPDIKLTTEILFTYSGVK